MHIRAALLIFMALATMSCGLNFGPSNAVKSCILPSDQSGTISGRWQGLPVPVAFHQGDFNSTEIATMAAAFETWNSFFSSVAGIRPINYYDNDPSVPRQSLMANPSSSGIALCGQSIVANNSYTAPVVIYKDMIWPSSPNYLPSMIALTTTCPTYSSPTKPWPFFMAYTELNYQYFFSPGQKIPDLQSIVTHEMGHLLGLGHSCEANSTAIGVPSCSNPDVDPDYLTALMFPGFSFNTGGAGEQRRSLNSNDAGRANCLYGHSAITVPNTPNPP